MKDEASWGIGVAAVVLVTLCLLPFVPIFWAVSKLTK